MDDAEIFRRNEIRTWASAQEGCVSLDRVELYEGCRVAGIVKRLRLDPSSNELRSTITDGTSWVTASWPLVRRMPQLRASPGSGVILEGVARIDASGDVVFVEPTFQLVSASEGSAT